ncbi:hypothetical protein G7046_g2251 [Stylonectria norvegica]|nr:hypothetical protein G7046_g2251 [Stylonectria norvegica]
MTTAAHHQQSQPSHAHRGYDTYDPDEAVPRHSPLMTPLRPKLEPFTSPSPEIPPAQVSHSPASFDGRDKSNRQKLLSRSGDEVLLTFLDNGRAEIARAAGREALACDEDIPEEDEFSLDGPTDEPVIASPTLPNFAADVPILQNLAAGASAPGPGPASKPVPDISVSTGQLSIRDDRPPATVAVVPTAVGYSARDPFSAIDSRNGAKSPPLAMLTPAGELPPLLQMDSPRSESGGHILPSIRSSLGDALQPAEKDLAFRQAQSSGFPRSPTVGGPRFHPMATSQTSPPPISPNDGYSRSLPSPRSLPASSPYYYVATLPHHRHGAEYSSSNTTGETPSTDQSTPATSTSVADRMSIDGITNPQYICNVRGCNAAPFQTQYLLNSHANVHSSARPHYCSVSGCARGEGGRGFKRKNEMIRHGLVHDSPGYVCPFCPDREHKYPRPDNLQRHVRVHHTDKDKDDPKLRDVLSQRPDGPNRGRRRRGPPG